jgi:acetyl esterase/lipase
MTRWRLSELPGEVESVRDLAYIEASAHAKHKLDVHRPQQRGEGAVVHFVHGGYWVEGDKDFHGWLTGLYGSIGVALAKRGVVTVIQNYRLAPDVGPEEMLSDVAAGLAWTFEHAADHGGDPSRVFMMGHSAGGHLVALHAAREAKTASVPRLRGHVILSGVFDLQDMRAHKDAAFNAKVTDVVFGGAEMELARYSPLNAFGPKVGPMLIMVGSRDEAYLIPQARRAHARLKALGQDAGWLELAGYTHQDMVLRFGTKTDPLSDAVLAFIARH